MTLMGRTIEGAANIHGALFLDGNGNGTFDRDIDFRFSGMFLPGPPDGVTDSQSLTAAACELSDRTNKGEWSPTLDAVLFPDAPRRTRSPVR